MKQRNIFLGIIISVGMTILASSSRFIATDALLGSSISAALYSFLFSMVVWFSHLYLFNNRTFSQLIKNTFWRSIISILIVALFSYLFCDRFLYEIIRNVDYIDESPILSKRPGLLFARNILRSAIYYFILFFQLAVEEKKNNELEIQQLRQAQIEAKISSLKEQLSPHFLFNTLNTLSTLTKEKEAQHFIAELANVYRYVLQYKNRDMVLLKQELVFIDSYWYILKMRFEDAIHLNVEIDEETADSLIPPLTLQILIENTVKHNISSPQRPLNVKIRHDAQYLIVENNLQLRKSEIPSTGEGLSNIMQQYSLLFDRNIEIKNEAETFSVRLPIIKKSNSPIVSFTKNKKEYESKF